MDFLLLLGRFHVLILHLPIGIVLLAIVSEFAARFDRFKGASAAASLLWTLGAVTAILTVILGLLHAAEGGFDPADLAAHRTWGIVFAAVTCVAAVLRAVAADAWQRAQIVFAIALLAIMTMTGHYGGNLTHGQTYLIEYAPF